MGIYFMFDNHTFSRLDDKPIWEAMDLLEEYSAADGGYGFIVCNGEHGNDMIQWRCDKTWRKEVREFLLSHQKDAFPLTAFRLAQRDAS